jgi:hypothetical protein
VAKITVGGSYDRSKSRIRAELSAASQMVLDIGSAHDMSSREISIIERDGEALSAELGRLRKLAEGLRANRPGDRKAAVVSAQAAAIADTGDRIVAERKWYSISVAGLVEAAKAVGEATSPLVASALKVIELFQKARANSSSGSGGSGAR